MERIRSKPQDYKGIHFDSKLEKDFYVYCEERGLILKHHPETLVLIPVTEYEDTFDLLEREAGLHKHKVKLHTTRGVKYEPDFRYMDVYIETKGYSYRDDWLKKYAIIRFVMPSLKILVVEHHADFEKYYNLLNNLF